MNTPINVLYIDDSPFDRDLVRDSLEEEHGGFVLTEASSRETFANLLAKGGYDLVLSDFNIFGFEGLQVLDMVHAKDPNIPVIIVTGTGSEEIAVEAMKRGAADYVIKKPSHIQRLPVTIHTVIEKQRLMKAVRESEERYRLLFESSLDGILLTAPDGRILSANPAACTMLEATEEEICRAGRSGVVDMDDPRLMPMLEERREKGKTKGELSLVRAGGITFPAEITSATFEDRYGELRTSMIIRDITDRKRAEEALRKSEHRFQTLAEMSPVGIFQTDAQGSTTYVNPRWCQISGMSREEALGAGWLGAVHSDDKERLSKGWQSATEVYDSSVAEYRFVRKDGSIAWVMGEAIPEKDIENKIVGYIGTITDITERKLMEEALRESQRQISLIYDTVGDILFNLKVEKDGSFSFASVNRSFLATTGLKANQILGKRVQEVIPEPSLSLALGKYAEAVREQKLLRWEETSEYPTGQLIGDVSIAPVFDEAMKCTSLVGSVHDITERKKADHNLRLSEKRFRSVWDNSADGMRLTDKQGVIIDVNAAFCKLVKMRREELLGKVLSVAYQRQGPDDDLSLYHKRFDARETISNLFGSATLRDGESIDLHISSSFIETAGQEKLLLSLFRDVTERNKAEKRLEQERTLLRTIIDAIPDEISVKDTERRFIVVNSGTVNALKRASADEIIGKRDEDFIPEHLMTEVKWEESAVLAVGGHSKNRVSDKIDPETGEIERSLLISKIPLKDSEGNIIGLVGINRDVTELKRIEEMLQKERTLLLTLIESSPDEVCFKDLTHRYVMANRASVMALGAASLAAMIGKTDRDFVPSTYVEQHFAEEDAIVASGVPVINREQTKLDPDTGEIEKCALTTKVPVKDQTGKMIGILVVNRDITARKRAEEALRSSEEKFRALFEESKDAVYISTVDGKLLDLNPAGIEMFGYGSKEEWSQVDLTHGYADLVGKKRFDRQMEKEGFVKDFELVLTRTDGKKLTVLETATAVRDKKGAIVQYRGMIRDVTAQRLLESQFIQAQKMESIGTLAGGIAHDFNNILGIVLGNLALLERTREDQGQFNESISSIEKAVERGASLVRQILTFARKSLTQLEPVNINAAIKELTKLLNETFPKTISMSLQLEKTIPIISMDPTQLHQTLLNLCVNARDAMNGRGELTIETQLVQGTSLADRFPNANANHYVRVRVRDTGSGMDEEIKQRIFEPFFTTKEEGKGTGLGLAVVYGVVQAHNGFIDVESAPGAGTTFNLFFAIPEGILAPDRPRPERSEELRGGDETILVVEDEPILRKLLVKFLETAGYTVIQASDGEEAVALYGAQSDDIDLVISDMGLPKQNGWEAIKVRRKVSPRIRALLASGYLEPNQRSEILKSGIKNIVNKPYHMEEILKVIRETLDERKNQLSG
jgi:two-component system, cell cycle sensor histidine kinase and response regulator CckA